MAEFETPEQLLAAVRRTREAGYREIDAFSPFPIENLGEAIGFHRTRLPVLVFIGGLLGCSGGFFLQWWPNVIGFPINVGGKPWNSWPAFIPITFELTILCAALTTFFGMLALNGLPTPYHPVFNVERFEVCSRDRFFLVIKARDRRYDVVTTREFLEGLNPSRVMEVES